MADSQRPVDDHHIVSPMTMVSSPQNQAVFSNNREDNAPEVAEFQHHANGAAGEGISPATAVASPHGSLGTFYPPPVIGYYGPAGDSEKESIHYDTTDKFPVAAEDMYTQYPQAVSDLHAKPDDAEPGKGFALGAAASTPPQKEPRKIFGMKRTLFFIILALICVIIAVAVGAGVGATVSKSSNPDDDASAPPASETSGSPDNNSSVLGSATPSPSPTGPLPSGSSSLPSSASTASSSEAKPTASEKPTFLNETFIGSGYGFQGYSKENYQNLYTDVITEEGETESGADFEFGINSYEWIARMTNCCVSFCNNATDEGWVGYQCQTKNQPVTSEPFTRIWVWCEDNHQKENARGRCSARRK